MTISAIGVTSTPFLANSVFALCARKSVTAAMLGAEGDLPNGQLSASHVQAKVNFCARKDAPAID